MASPSFLWAYLWLGVSLFVEASEYGVLSNFKDSSPRTDKFINTNGGGMQSHNSIGSAGQFGAAVPSSSGISTAYMAEERTLFDTYTMATVNHTYYDTMDELFRSTLENNAKFGEGKILTVHGKLVHVTSERDHRDHTACHPQLRGTNGRR